MESINRKTLLYKSGVEYADYCINHVEGCSHGCKFPCYAFLLKKRCGKIKTYEEWCKPKIVGNALELLEKEIPKFKGKVKCVHLSFSTDPFMYGQDNVSNLSLQIIKKLNQNGIRCTVLTKGILPQDLTNSQLYDCNNEYGITLVSLDKKFRSDFEPNTSDYQSRVQALKQIKENGFKTWVSIEPYPTPNIIEQNLDNILEAISFVDKIIFGKMNYNPLVTKFKDKQGFYNILSRKVIKFCTESGIKYHIKEGTLQD